MLLDTDPGLRYRDSQILVEDVRLDASGPEHSLVVLILEATRPECLFGWRWTLDPPDHLDIEDPYFPAMIAAANLQEYIQGGPGLPSECEPDDVTWF